MTELSQGVGEPTPIWVEQQPFQANPFNEQQGSSSSPRPFHLQQGDQPQGSNPPSPSFQYGFVPPVVRPVATKSPLIALVCGILSWTLMGPGVILSIVAIIFGVKGRREHREGRTPDAGMATAGIWLGSISLGFCAFFFLVLTNLRF